MEDDYYLITTNRIAYDWKAWYANKKDKKIEVIPEPVEPKSNFFDFDD